MAKYEHLPIYKKAYDLNLFIEKAVHNFSRYNKYTLGTELRNNAREIAKLIVRANNRQDKLSTLVELREKLEEMKLVVRMCRDMKVFAGSNVFAIAINLVIDISKQNEGWLKSLSKI